METRIRISTPFGEVFQLIPHYLQSQIVWPFRDKATLDVHYPKAGVKSELLDGECEAVFEYRDGTVWFEPLDSRFRMEGWSRDRLEDTPTRNAQFIALIPSMLENAYVWDPTGLTTDAEGNILFPAATPGVILRTLFLNAQARGWGAALSVDFTDSHDSNGQAWDGSLNLTVRPEQNILEILQALGNQGIVDWAGQGRTLRVFNPDTFLGRDRTNVVLRAAQGETSAPEEVKYTDRATQMLVVGEGGESWVRPNGSSPWGRLETIMSAGGVTDQGTAFLLSDEALLKASGARVSRTREFDQVSKFLPHRDYRGGDHVQYQTDDGLESMRVFSVSLTIGERLTGHAVLGDRFEDALISAARKQNSLTIGKINGGNGQQPTQPTDDVRTPEAPLGFVMSSSVYMDPVDGAEVGRVHAGWSHTGKATDQTAMTIDRFEFRIRESLVGDADWHSFRSVHGDERNATFSPVTVRREDDNPFVYDFAIRAVGANSRVSGWVYYRGLLMETDSTPPPVPSAPVGNATYGAITIAWDGLGEGDEPMPPDFLHTEAEIGESPTGPWMFAGNFERAGGMVVPFQLPYATYWLRLRSVDRVGNKSEWSALGEIDVVPLYEHPDMMDLIDGLETEMDSIRQSANGANRVFNKTTPPTIDGLERDGDSWFQWTPGQHLLDPKVLIGHWVWMDDEWAAVEAGHQIVGSIDFGKGVFGVLDGDFIKAGTLHIGSQVVVADMNNLASVNPDLGVNISYPDLYSTETVGGFAYKAPLGPDRLVFMNQAGPVPVVSGDWVRMVFVATAESSVSAVPRVWVFPNADNTDGAVAGSASTIAFSPGTHEYTADIEVPDLAGVNGGLSWFAGLEGPGIRDIGVRLVKVYKKTNATLISPNSILTPHLGAEIIESEHIKANTIEGDRMAGGFADFIVMTGSLVQTVEAVNRGIKMIGDTNSLRSWNLAGEQTFFLDGDTGNVMLGKNQMIKLYGTSGNVDIGNGRLTINGATGHLRIEMGNEGGHAVRFLGDDNRSMQMGADANGGYIGFSVPAFFAAGVLRLEETNNAITLRSPRPNSGDEAGYIRMFPGDAPGNGPAPIFNTNSKMQFTRSDAGLEFINGAIINGQAVMRITAGASIYMASQGLDASDSVNSDLHMFTDEVGRYVRSYTVYNREYTAGSNLYITAAGFLGRTTSKSANKLSQRVLEIPDSVMDIPMKSWLDRSETLEREELGHLGVRTMGQQTLMDQAQRRVVGMIAEEVEKKAPDFVTYGPDGDIEGFDREGLALARTEVLWREIKSLRAQLAIMKGKG